MFRMHHVALSVSDSLRSITYYEIFGFELKYSWCADDGTLEISHLMMGEAMLELFCYATNREGRQSKTALGNDLTVLGIKHFGLAVESLDLAKQHLIAAGVDPGSPVVRGRTGVDYFFVQDPDGNWLEIVKDDRGAPDKSVTGT